MDIISIDDLLYLASLRRIKIVFENLSEIHPEYLGKANAATRTIFLDWSLRSNPRKLKCILTEEIGHILWPGRPGHIRYHSRKFIDTDFYKRGNIKVIVAQDERKALDWATSVLMPFVEFGRILRNDNMSLAEVAEYFDVEPWFANLRINYYKRKHRL